MIFQILYVQDVSERVSMAKLTSFDGDPVGTFVGLAEGDTDGALLGVFEGGWLGLDVGFV